MKRALSLWWLVVATLVFLSRVGGGIASAANDGADSGTETALVEGVDLGLHAWEMDPEFEPKRGTYSYSIHWVMKTGAKAEVSVEQWNGKYHMTTTARTGKFVDLFYRVRYKGDAVLDVASLEPHRIEVNETVRSTKKHTVMEFDDGMIRTTRTRTKRDKQRVSVTNLEMNTENGRIMDYFSAILMARALPWQEGARRSFCVFDGRGLNTVSLDCGGRGRMTVQGEDVDTWHIKVKIVQIGELDEDDELIADNIHLYMTSDKSREIVLVEADTPYGNIKVKLDGFQPILEGSGQAPNRSVPLSPVCSAPVRASSAATFQTGKEHVTVVPSFPLCRSSTPSIRSTR